MNHCSAQVPRRVNTSWHLLGTVTDCLTDVPTEHRFPFVFHQKHRELNTELELCLKWWIKEYFKLRSIYYLVWDHTNQPKENLIQLMNSAFILPHSFLHNWFNSLKLWMAPICLSHFSVHPLILKRIPYISTQSSSLWCGTVEDTWW
jgi:hypothetical protein